MIKHLEKILRLPKLFNQKTIESTNMIAQGQYTFVELSGILHLQYIFFGGGVRSKFV